MDMNKGLAGVAIASAAAALFLAGCSSTGSTGHFDNPAYAKVKCYGANACKGQGFVMLEERACIEKLGRA